jgi:membrane protease YdiL (CAAX protease family)
VRLAVLFATLLVAWGNVAAWSLGATATLPGGSLAFALAGIALTVVSLVVAERSGLGARSLFGTRREAVRGVVIGAISAAVVALASLGFLRFIAPAITGSPVEYAPLARVGSPELAAHVLVLLPLGVVVPEEIAFRGTLLALAMRSMGLRRSVFVSAIAFALWHVSVIVATVRDTTLGPPSPWFPVACIGAWLVVVAGGVAFVLLRVRTRTITTTMAAHWLFNAVLLIGLWWS